MADQMPDKLDKTLSIRVPEKVHAAYSLLTEFQKHECQRQLRITIAKAIHLSTFDPEKILGEEA